MTTIISAYDFLKAQRRYRIEVKSNPLDTEYKVLSTFSYLDIASRCFNEISYQGCKYYTVRIYDTVNNEVLNEYFNF